MLSLELVAQGMPYLTGLASGVLIASSVSLAMMRRKSRMPVPSRAELATEHLTSATQLPAAPAEPEDDPAAPPAVLVRRSNRRLLRPEVAAREFIAFMRENSMTGWYASEEIDTACLWFFQRTATVEMDPSDVRAQLAAIKACRHGYKRLKGPEFEGVRQATKRDRATVYYIPPIGVPIDAHDTASAPQFASNRPETGRAPSRSGAQPPSGRSSNGGRAAGGTKGSNSRGTTVATAAPDVRQGFDFVPADLFSAAA